MKNKQEEFDREFEFFYHRLKALKNINSKGEKWVKQLTEFVSGEYRWAVLEQYTHYRVVPLEELENHDTYFYMAEMFRAEPRFEMDTKALSLESTLFEGGKRIFFKKTQQEAVELMGNLINAKKQLTIEDVQTLKDNSLKIDSEKRNALVENYWRQRGALIEDHQERLKSLDADLKLLYET